MEAEQVKQIIEALLFTSDKPLTLTRIKEVLDGVDVQVIKAQLNELRDAYADAGRSFNITEVAGGYSLSTDPKYAPWLKRLYNKTGSEKLSGPSLETLAIIAYRQPITRLEIEDIRGVNVDGVLRTLLERSLVRISGRKDIAGRPFLYSTTRYFLEFFGLQSLSELPKLEEFGELMPQGGEADVAVKEVAQEDRPD